MFFDADVSDIVLPLEQDNHLLGRSKTRFLGSASCWVRIPARGQQEARHHGGDGLLGCCGAPSGMSVCGWPRPLPLRRFAPCVLRWKTLRVSSAPHPVGFESRLMGRKKPLTELVTGFTFQMVPPAGFEPAISTLKGWRPWPLDDGDSGKEYSRLFCRRVYRWQTGKPPHRSRLLFRFSNISICNIWAGKSALSVTDRDRRRASGRTSQSVTVRRLLSV